MQTPAPRIPANALSAGLLRAAQFDSDGERARLYRQLADLTSWLSNADSDLAGRILLSPGYDPPLSMVRDAIQRSLAAASLAAAKARAAA